MSQIITTDNHNKQIDSASDLKTAYNDESDHNNGQPQQAN